MNQLQKDLENIQTEEEINVNNITDKVNNNLQTYKILHMKLRNIKSHTSFKQFSYKILTNGNKIKTNTLLKEKDSKQQNINEEVLIDHYIPDMNVEV